MGEAGIPRGSSGCAGGKLCSVGLTPAIPSTGLIALDPSEDNCLRQSSIFPILCLWGYCRLVWPYSLGTRDVLQTCLAILRVGCGMGFLCACAVID